MGKRIALHLAVCTEFAPALKDQRSAADNAIAPAAAAGLTAYWIYCEAD